MITKELNVAKNKNFTIINLASMIKSGEWDTADAFFVALFCKGCDSAKEIGDENKKLVMKVLVEQSIMFLASSRSPPASFMFYKDGSSVKNSSENCDNMQIQNQTKKINFHLMSLSMTMKSKKIF